LPKSYEARCERVSGGCGGGCRLPRRATLSEVDGQHPERRRWRHGCVSTMKQSASQEQPPRLRVEHLDRAFRIDVPSPRLSWLLPPGAQRQLAYHIRADTWDSGWVESDRSILVPYGGPPLSSGACVTWSVKVLTDAGESDWSEPMSWEMGLLSA